MKQVAVLVVLFGLVGCAPMPWHVKETTSRFDNSTTISVGPAWVGGDSLMKMGLYRKSTMDPNNIVLKAQVKGTHSFGIEPTLTFKIDGDMTPLTSIDKRADIETDPGYSGGGLYIAPHNLTTKRYIITRALLERLIHAQEVIIRIQLDGSFVEGALTDYKFMSAYEAFLNFHKKVNGI